MAGHQTNDAGFDNLIQQLYNTSRVPIPQAGANQFQPPPMAQVNGQWYGGAQSSSTMNNPQHHASQDTTVNSQLPNNILRPHHLDQHQQRRPGTMTSNAETGGPSVSQSNSDRTAGLLNLLKFSGPGSNQAAPISLPQTTSTITEGRSTSFASAPHQATTADGRNTPGTDLMAALMGNSYTKPAQQAQSQDTPRVSSSSFRPQPSAPPAETQNFLLSLLNRPKPAQNNSSASVATSTKAQATQDVSTPEVTELSKAMEQSSLGDARRASGKPPAPIVFGSSAATSTPVKNLFTYENPFDELARSSPRNRAPKQTRQAEPAAPPPAPMQILKHPRHGPASEVDGYSRKSEERSQFSSPAYSKRKLSNSTPSSPVPVLADGRTELDALIGIGAPNQAKETVSEALNEVGEQVNKQVEAALEEAEQDEAQAEIEKDLSDMINAKTDEEFQASAQLAAQAIKKALDKDGNERVLKDSLTSPVADAVKEIIEETAQGQVAEDWEDADDSTLKEATGQVVKVYNFPMKPFVSLTICLSIEDRLPLRAEATMNIARLKKDFDQIDRTLVTATDTFMINCAPKTGGIRLIHQGNGNHFKLFTNHGDRLFSITALNAGGRETVLGTGVSNTVYWAVITQGEYDEDFCSEMHSFALPPSQIHDGESPGVLKTRARKSGSHTEFFAVGRGKCIHIIQPDVILSNKSYLDVENRVVNTEKYLNEHAMIINTGKAGKDFAFSPDDTIIVSLDKAGKVKIWDIRPFTAKWVSSKNAVAKQTGEIKEPMMTLVTSPPSEKSWATSVMFADKARPYQKGGPLRYLIIGMKQNHTLQLWDLALGRVVQEINLPHEKESDAVCSVLYHPPTSIIIVGHPTRNSIYFIHMSQPKYGLSKGQNQAEYMEHLISRDAAQSKPDSTAVMSGVREFSFSTPDNGVLRSLEILQEPCSCNPVDTEPVLFELYAMHSKGITCMPIRQEDLGWSADNRVLNPVDAEKAGAVRVETLKSLSSVPLESLVESHEGSPASSSRAVVGSPASSSRAVNPRTTSKDSGARDPAKKILNPRDHRSNSSETMVASVRPPTPVIKGEKSATKSNGSLAESSGISEKPTRNRKKKNASATGSPLASLAMQSETSTMENPTLLTRNGSPSKSQKSVLADGASAVAATEAVMSPAPQHSAVIDQRFIDSVVSSITPELSRIVDDSAQAVYKRIDEDRRLATADSAARQETVLRLVSNALSENIHEALEKSVRQNVDAKVLPTIEQSVRQCIDAKVLPTIEQSVHKFIDAKVLPTVIQMTSQTLNDQLGGKLSSHINKYLPRELRILLPEALSQAFQQPALLASVSDALAGVVVNQVESHITATLERTIMPTFTKMVTQTAQSIVNEAQQHARAQMESLTYQHNQDNAQIAQLTQLVTNLSTTVAAMAEVQTKFQDEFLQNQRQLSDGRLTPSFGRSMASVRASSPPMSRSMASIPAQYMANDGAPSPSFGRSMSSVRAPSVARTSVARTPVSSVVEAPSLDQQIARTAQEISDAFARGEVEAGFIIWLQSGQEEPLFKAFFSKLPDMNCLDELSPLVLLSVGCAITVDLVEFEVFMKLEWILKIFENFPVRGQIRDVDERIRPVFPNTMRIMESRLEDLIGRFNVNTRGRHPIIAKVSAMLDMAKEIRRVYGLADSN